MAEEARAEVKEAREAVKRAEEAAQQALKAAVDNCAFIPVYQSAQACYQAAQVSYQAAQVSYQAASYHPSAVGGAPVAGAPVASASDGADLCRRFSSPEPNSNLPFMGRNEMMESVATRIDTFVQRASSTGISKESMLFLSYEGYAGVGKSRCLIETRASVGNKLARSDSILAELYRSGAVQAVYITFSGSAVASGGSHSMSSRFRPPAGEDARITGKRFMQACIVSQVVYGTSFAELPMSIQEEISSFDISAAMTRVVNHIRAGVGLAPDKAVVLYVLIDESQLLLRWLEEWYGQGVALEFLRGMFGYLGHFMTSSLSSGLKLILVPILAGTVFAVQVHFGISEWPCTPLEITPLDRNISWELLLEGCGRPFEIGCNSTLFQSVARDSFGIPHYIEYMAANWHLVKATDVDYAAASMRCAVVLRVDQQVTCLIPSSNLLRLLRHCITGVPTETEELAECLRGYLLTRKVHRGYQHEASILLLHQISQRLGGVHKHVLLLQPPEAKAEALELAFLDAVHARLLLYAGSRCRLEELFTGIVGDSDFLSTQVTVPREIFITNKGQYYNTGDKFTEVNGAIVRLPCAGYFLKTKQNTCIVDGRVQLSGEVPSSYWSPPPGRKRKGCVEESSGQGLNFLQLDFQLKGSQKRYSEADAKGLFEAYSSRQFELARYLIIISVSGFSFNCQDFSAKYPRVVFLDKEGLDKVMPGFVARCMCD